MVLCAQADRREELACDCLHYEEDTRFLDLVGIWEGIGSEVGLVSVWCGGGWEEGRKNGRSWFCGSWFGLGFGPEKK